LAIDRCPIDLLAVVSKQVACLADTATVRRIQRRGQKGCCCKCPDFPRGAVLSPQNASEVTMHAPRCTPCTPQPALQSAEGAVGHPLGETYCSKDRKTRPVFRADTFSKYFTFIATGTKPFAKIKEYSGSRARLSCILNEQSFLAIFLVG